MGRAADYARCCDLGMTAADTASLLGVTQRAVRLWSSRVGRDFNGQRRKPPEIAALGERLRKMAAQGKTAKQMAEECGLTYVNARSHLRRLNLSVAKSKQGKKPSLTKPRTIELPPHIQEWVAIQCGPGVTVEDMIAAIVTDAYLDAKEGKE